MSGKITVSAYKRRRTGKTARMATLLGLDPTVKIEPYKRRRPGMVAYRHQDDGTLCGDTVIETRGLINRDRCPHGREIKLA